MSATSSVSAGQGVHVYHPVSSAPAKPSYVATEASQAKAASVQHSDKLLQSSVTPHRGNQLNVVV